MKTLQRALAALLIACTGLASAAPAQQQTQVPGYYRLKLGGFEITALYDGYIDIDQKVLQGLKAGDLQSLLAKMFIADSKAVQTPVNAFLVHTGSQLLLIDTGTAQCFGPALGNIPANLRAAGYEGAQVDAVLLTHLHPDHACGLLAADGKPNFPNATVYASRTEAGYWLAGGAPADKQALAKMAIDAVAPYQRAGRFKTFTPGDQLLSVVTTEDTHGHTPGHASYRLKTPEGPELLVLGDLIHSHAVQFARPELSVEFDTDGKAAVASRRQAFDEAVRDRVWVAGAHLPFPGLGHIRAEGRAYAWVPVEYGPWR